MTITSVPQARLTDTAAMRLVCLPYAGGGTAVFHRWRSAIPDHCDLMPLCLPGHDGRLGETPRTDLCSLVRELSCDLAPILDRQYVLLGHSLGAWIAFELARELRRGGARPPSLVIVAAGRPPDTAMEGPSLHTLPDAEFLAAVQQRYDGIPQAILGNAELLEMLLSVLRADIEMVETYRYTPEAPLDVEILALGGADDPAVSADQLRGWQTHTTRDCSVRMFPGGHFFLFRGAGRQSPMAPNETISPALQAIIMALKKLYL